MKFRNPIQTLVDYQFYLHDKWYPWFAWYPVVIKKKVVWLEFIEKCRREEGCGSDYRCSGDTTPTNIERYNNDTETKLRNATQVHQYLESRLSRLIRKYRK